MSHSRCFRFRAGFTIIELVALVASVLLLGILFIAGCNSRQELAQKTKCRTRLKGFLNALVMYCETNDGVFPSLGPGTTLTDEPVAGHFTNAANSNLQAYALMMVEDGDVSAMQFKCPTDSDYQKPSDEDNGFDSALNSSYAFQPSGAGSNNLPYLQNGTSGGAVIAGDRRPENSGWVSGNHEDGGNYMTFSGSVSWQKTSKCGLQGNDVYELDSELGVDDSYLIGR